MKLELNECWTPQIDPMALKTLVQRNNVYAWTNMITYFALLGTTGYLAFLLWVAGG